MDRDERKTFSLWFNKKFKKILKLLCSKKKKNTKVEEGNIDKFLVLGEFLAEDDSVNVTNIEQIIYYI